MKPAPPGTPLPSDYSCHSQLWMLLLSSALMSDFPLFHTPSQKYTWTPICCKMEVTWKESKIRCFMNMFTPGPNYSSLFRVWRADVWLDSCCFTPNTDAYFVFQESAALFSIYSCTCLERFSTEQSTPVTDPSVGLFCYNLLWGVGRRFFDPFMTFLSGKFLWMSLRYVVLW